MFLKPGGAFLIIGYAVEEPITRRLSGVGEEQNELARLGDIDSVVAMEIALRITAMAIEAVARRDADAVCGGRVKSQRGRGRL